MDPGKACLVATPMKPSNAALGVLEIVIFHEAKTGVGC